MNLLIALGLIVASLWLLWKVFARLRRQRAGAGWLGLAGGVLVVGLALGWWTAFHFEYHASARMRVFSAPLPIAFFVWEEDRWTDFVTPEYYAYPALAANTLSIAALVVSPLLFLKRKAAIQA
jgi:hypothetical protein